MENETIYDLVVSILGEPQGEFGPYVVYVVSAFILIYIIYMILTLFLTLFRWIWGR